jgi:Helix-turn-helix domain
VPKRIATPTEPALCSEGLVKPHPDGTAFLQVSKTSIYAAMNKGLLAYVEIGIGGRDRRIPKRALIAFAESRIRTGKDTAS